MSDSKTNADRNSKLGTWIAGALGAVLIAYGAYSLMAPSFQHKADHEVGASSRAPDRPAN